jgi:hypothetical protein
MKYESFQAAAIRGLTRTIQSTGNIEQIPIPDKILSVLCALTSAKTKDENGDAKKRNV